MNANVVDRIIAQVRQPGIDVLRLLDTYRAEKYGTHWLTDARLHCAFASALISADHPTDAYELVQSGLEDHGPDLEPKLHFLRALALSRMRDVSTATEVLDGLMQHPALSRELREACFSLRGSLLKERCRREGDAGRRAEHALAAAELYRSAYALCRGHYSAVNAATMLMLAGRTGEAHDLARAVIGDNERPSSPVREDTGAEERTYWLLASLGEAHLILGETNGALDCYAHAKELIDERRGDKVSMLRNLNLLRAHVEIPQEVFELLRVGGVVAFAGHMVDHPRRVTDHGLAARFPPDPALEKALGTAIRTTLEERAVVVGYCSAACGSDILFAEALIDRGAELHVVLPYDEDDFLRTSVDFEAPGMRGWAERFARVKEAAKDVHFATTEEFRDDDELYRFVNDFTQGLTVVHARKLGEDPRALVVMDPAAEEQVGGTVYFRRKWLEKGFECDMIDLCDVRDRAAVVLPAIREVVRARAPSRCDEEHRTVRTMLFADFEGFSGLQEKHSPSFFKKVLPAVADLLRQVEGKKPYSNTWGDGLFLVFEDVVPCAKFALRLLDMVKEFRWEAEGLPAPLQIRIGIHAGPVFPCTNPFTGKADFFGSHVNRAARIEPRTPENCAYASEQFAALLALEAGRSGQEHPFVCEYAGVLNLHKGFDRCALYRLY